MTNTNTTANSPFHKLTVGSIIRGRLASYKITKHIRNWRDSDIWKAQVLSPTCTPVIIKTAPSSFLDRERTFLRLFRHQPRIRQLLDECCYPEEANGDHYHHHHHHHHPPALVLQYYDDNLLSAAKARRLNRIELHAVARAVLEGLQVMHERGWVHTDLKPDNIFVNYASPSTSQTGAYRNRFASVVLGDFAQAVHLGPHATHTHTIPGSLVNAAIFRAPEALLDRSWGKAVDVWAFGVTMISLMAGNDYQPFRPRGSSGKDGEDERRPMAVLDVQRRRCGDPPAEWWGDMEEMERVVDEYNVDEDEVLLEPRDRAFVEGCLRWDDGERKTVAALLRDRWFEDEAEEGEALQDPEEEERREMREERLVGLTPLSLEEEGWAWA